MHEYGGGAYWVAEDDAIFVVNQPDQRIYRLADGGPQPLTPPAGSPATVRYADLRTLPGGRLVCVRERHEPDGQVVNELVTLPADDSRPSCGGGARTGLLLLPAARPLRHPPGLHLLGPPSDAMGRHRALARRPR